MLLIGLLEKWKQGLKQAVLAQTILVKVTVFLQNHSKIWVFMVYLEALQLLF